MTNQGERPERPLDLPVDIGDALEAHADDPHDLREAIIYTQELLNDLHEPPFEIEPNEGEEILKIVERDEHIQVVKRTQGEMDPYLYHVRREPRPNDEEHLQWVLIGRVHPDDF